MFFPRLIWLYGHAQAWACHSIFGNADNGSRPLSDFGVGPASVTKPEIL